MGSIVRQFVELVLRWCLHKRHKRIRRLCEQAEMNVLPEDIAQAQMYAIRPLIEEQRRRPNFLEAAPEFEELYPDGPPDIVFGQLSEVEDVPVGLFLDSKVSLLAAGQSKYGKTSTVRWLILAIVEHNRRYPQRPVRLVVFENKPDDYAGLKERIGDTCVHFDLHKQTLIGLNAPVGVDPDEWINHVIPCFCVRAGLQYGGITLAHTIRWVLPLINEGGQCDRWPDPAGLLWLLRHLPVGVLASKADYSRSVIQVVEGWSQFARRLFQTSNGLDLERDCFAKGKEVVILSMGRLSPPWLRHFVMDLFLLQLLLGRMARGHRPGYTDVVTVLGECDSYVAAAEESRFSGGMGPPSYVSRTGREYGLGEIFDLGEMGLMAPHIAGSVTTACIFSQKHSRDVLQASQTLRLPSRAEGLLVALETGEAVVRLPGTWAHAMLCHMHHIPPSATVTTEFDESPAAPPVDVSREPRVLEALKAVKPKAKADGSSKTKDDDLVPAPAGQFMRLLADNRYRTVAELTKLMQPTPSRETLESLLEHVQEKELVDIEPLRIGSTKQRFIELTEKGWKSLGTAPPAVRGRGGVAHRTISARVSGAWSSARGYAGHMEWTVPGTTHHSDAMVEMNGEVWCFEIVVHTESNLPDHLVACLITSDAVDGVVVVAAQKKILNQLRKTIEAEDALRGCLDRIRYETIDRYLED